MLPCGGRMEKYPRETELGIKVLILHKIGVEHKLSGEKKKLTSDRLKDKPKKYL